MSEITEKIKQELLIRCEKSKEKDGYVNVNIKMNIFSNLIMQKNLHFYIVIHHRF